MGAGGRLPIYSLSPTPSLTPTHTDTRVHANMVSPIINRVHLCGMCVKIDEPMYPRYLKSIVHITTNSECCTFYGVSNV